MTITDPREAWVVGVSADECQDETAPEVGEDFNGGGHRPSVKTAAPMGLHRGSDIRPARPRLSERCNLRVSAVLLATVAEDNVVGDRIVNEGFEVIKGLTNEEGASHVLSPTPIM